MRHAQTSLSPAPGTGPVPAIDPEPQLGFVLYRSVASPGLEEDDIDRLLRRAQHRNRSLGLTGCLHHENGLFFQWLEGPRAPLFRLLEELRDDFRHVGFTVLDQGTLEARVFDDWDMQFSDRQGASLNDWLARDMDPMEEAQAVGQFLASLRD